MTTITVRDGIMACDSQVGISSDGGGDRAYYNCTKVFEIPDEFIGGAGESEGILLFFEWYMNGCTGKQTYKIMVDCDFDIIILHKDGTLEAWYPSGVSEIIHEKFYAIGSGTKCALAAMYCGKSAKDAIEITKKIDPHTGGRVRTYTHG